MVISKFNCHMSPTPLHSVRFAVKSLFMWIAWLRQRSNTRFAYLRRPAIKRIINSDVSIITDTHMDAQIVLANQIGPACSDVACEARTGDWVEHAKLVSFMGCANPFSTRLEMTSGDRGDLSLPFRAGTFGCWYKYLTLPGPWRTAQPHVQTNRIRKFKRIFYGVVLCGKNKWIRRWG